MNVQLDDAVAVVTGSTAGIGRAVADEFAAQGATVAINGRTAERCERVAADIEAAGATATAHPADINDYDAVAGMIDDVVATHGTLDVVVPNGAATSGPAPTFFRTTDPADLDEFWDRYLANRLYVVKAALEPLIEAGGGRVVNISSDAGRWPTPGEIGPGAASAGLMMATKVLADELGRWDIRVNTVSISITEDTPALDWVKTESDAATVFEAAADRQEFAVTPEAVAETVAFLAGAAGAGSITGQLVSHNGGISFPG